MEGQVSKTIRFGTNLVTLKRLHGPWETRVFLGVSGKENGPQISCFPKDKEYRTGGGGDQDLVKVPLDKKIQSPVL